jgi:hypothetical protein
VTEPQRLLKAFVARYTQQARIGQSPQE